MIVLAVGVAAFVLALLVYHQLAPQAQKYWLVFLSYAFYAWCAWRFLPVLVVLTLATYGIAARIRAAPRSQNGTASGSRRRWLWAGVVLNVAALAGLRYGYRSAPFAAPFAVLGLSFYSLQALAYLFDTHSGTLRTPHTLADFTLYLAYFPKLLAGPIEAPQTFLRQLAQPRIVDDQRLARAITLIAVGVTRKIVIADPLSAQLPADAFTAPASFGAMTLAAVTIGHAFVLYNDFAGYSSVARGVSCLFGIELSPNFARPFAARSFTDLWTRWHISLSHWLRDYIYMPLSRRLLRRRLRRTNAANILLPPMATMLVCGLWHGASAHMLLWGGLHGVFLIVERMARLRWPPAPGAVLPPWRQAGGALLVFTLSCWAFIALRLPIDQAVQFWRQLVLGPLGAAPDGRLLLFMIPSIWIDWMQSRHGEDTLLMPWPQLGRATALATAVLLWLVLSGGAGPMPFVYQGF